METEVTNTNQEQQGQESTPENQSDSTVDYKALYLDEVQNAKKLRKRSQDAESSLQEFTKKQETNKVKQMQEKEQYKELYESVAPFKDKWESYENNRREALLAKLPEEDKESMSSKDLDVLEYVVKVREEAKPVSLKHTSQASRNVNDGMPAGNVFDKMDSDSIKSNWDNVVSSYKDKHSKR
tara:strand:- start:180 stop:725 length:546 start_codon:yes stop_codon:yes gene_type:complete